MAMSIKSVFEFLIEKKFAVWSSLISSLLIIGQEIFTTYAFKCPCDHELSMAITCMVVLIPVVVLVCFGCLLQSDAWTPCSGCSSGRKCRCASCCWAVMAKASVAPIVWLSIALLTGDYYACAMSGSFSPSSATLGVIRNVSGSITEVLARVPCPDITLHPSIPDATAANIRREINTKLHTLSQVCIGPPSSRGESDAPERRPHVDGSRLLSGRGSSCGFLVCAVLTLVLLQGRVHFRASRHLTIVLHFLTNYQSGLSFTTFIKHNVYSPDHERFYTAAH